MQVTNSTNLNFKALSFTPNALAAMSHRMPSGRFISVQESLIKKYKTSPLDIVIDTTSDESIRLCAKIMQIDPVSGKLKTITRYFEESVFSSVFNRSEKFIEKLCKTIDKQEQLVLGKKSQ